jgi:hypothetical protein
MGTFVVRVWIPDRPGALGAVASRIGSVRGDLTGIDILERGAGLAIDELVVVLPDDSLVPLLLSEIAEVDGVAVEDCREVPGGIVPDPGLTALETAALLVQQPTASAVLSALALHAAADFDAPWAAVVEAASGFVHAAVGPCPPASWISAFANGSRSAQTAAGPDDMAWAHLDHSDLDLILGRPGRPVRDRERSQLVALARIADLRWTELARGSALRSHPSAV